jgi:hypothetical protein
MTYSVLVAVVRNWRSALSSGQVAILSEIAVLYGLPRDTAVNTHFPQQLRDNAMGGVDVFGRTEVPLVS